MGNILFTRELISTRFFLVWILGLGMLLALSADSLALPKRMEPGKIYCQCTCDAGIEGKDLYWEKKAHCRLNGRSCEIKDPIRNGTTVSCTLVWSVHAFQAQEPYVRKRLPLQEANLY
jgi:hypothetical protein